MAGHWTDLYSFVTGAIRRKDLGYLILSDDNAAEKKIPMSGIAQWKPIGWGDGGQTSWRASGAAIAKIPSEQLIVVGEFGRALLLGGGDRHEEEIVSKSSNPTDRGPLRGVRLIGDNIYVVGMDRQVYRRDGVNTWSSYEQDITPSSDENDISGFESIDGFTESDMYAVGWNGEIWNCTKGRWHQESSPVNTVLLDVCCAGNGTVYACGRNGVLIQGRKGQWNVVDLGTFGEELWSIVWFEGRLYGASIENVFVLGSNGFSPVHMGDDHVKSCYKLVTGDGVLWSVGAKDVMCFDGMHWTRID